MPNRAVPCRAEPSCAEPSRAVPNRAVPSRAEPSRAEPNRAEPCHKNETDPTKMFNFRHNKESFMDGDLQKFVAVNLFFISQKQQFSSF